MRRALEIALVLLVAGCAHAKPAGDARMTYLALGDSYTIGEGVAVKDRWPVQLAGMLGIAEPTIIAKTGWTTDELAAAIPENLGTFSLVTLLIGVNNQYRGRPLPEYREQFVSLLRGAVNYAGGRADHVVVLSIPDWGVTPFAKDRDRAKIAFEIDRFNDVNRAETRHAGAHWVDVTAISRADPQDVVADGLHPSPRAYAAWARAALPQAEAALKDDR